MELRREWAWTGVMNRAGVVRSLYVPAVVRNRMERVAYDVLEELEASSVSEDVFSNNVS